MSKEDFTKAQAAVLEKLGQKSSSPEALITALKSEGFAEDLVRAATWDLIDRRRVKVTRDWHLERAEQQPT